MGDRDVGYLRIGELARRTGLNPELVRAWERRYGLLQPNRSAGGFRLYGDGDLARLETMKRHLAVGVSAAEAARLTLAEPSRPAEADPGESLEDAGHELWGALERFDEASANAAIDRALATFTLESVLRDLVLPYLRELGACWQRGEIGIAQEHFASHLLRGRLLGLARGWGQGSGPLAVLACAPGEQHDLGLICFGLVLRSAGWRLVFLGADTPVEAIADLADRLSPSLVVVTAVEPTQLTAVESGLGRVAAHAPLALGGDGASTELAERLGARLLSGDPVAAALALTMPVAA